MSGWIAVGVFIVGMVLLNRLLRRWERRGWWDKEDHGSPEHPRPGVDYRWLEVPPKRPFD